MPGEKLLGKNIFLVMQFHMLAVQFNPGSINWGVKDVKREYHYVWESPATTKRLPFKVGPT
jgi:hypothetical protein